MGHEWERQCGSLAPKSDGGQDASAVCRECRLGGRNSVGCSASWPSGPGFLLSKIPVFLKIVYQLWLG